MPSFFSITLVHYFIHYYKIMYSVQKIDNKGYAWTQDSL